MASAASGAIRAARGASYRLTEPQQWQQSRGFAISRAIRLPRQGLPRPPPLSSASTSAIKVEDVPNNVLREHKITPKITSKNPSKEVPWFLQDEETIEIGPSKPLQRQTLKPTSITSAHLDLPEPLASLHELLTEGSPSALLARADDIDGGREPIVYINAKKYSEDAWADWIIVVQVKSNAGGSVSRVAKEIGGFLKHERPPASEAADLTVVDAVEGSLRSEEQQINSIEDFLGQVETESPRSLERPLSIAKETQSGGALGARDEAVETGKKAWRPYKIISREAQDGMRLLHSSDPEKWNRKELAMTFKISVESVRRILTSRFKPSARVIGRQNRRALEREEEKRAGRTAVMIENAEVEAIREAMREGNENVDEDEQEYKLQGEEGDEDGTRYVQQVTYEGLVQSGDNGRHTRGKSRISRGDGEWCLVDAGWCVVHVMTARARQTYDVEAVASNIKAADLSVMS